MSDNFEFSLTPAQVQQATIRAQEILDNAFDKKYPQIARLQFEMEGPINFKDPVLDLVRFWDDACQYFIGKGNNSEEFHKKMLQAFDLCLIPESLFIWAANRPKPKLLMKTCDNFAEMVSSTSKFVNNLPLHPSHTFYMVQSASDSIFTTGIWGEERAVERASMRYARKDLSEGIANFSVSPQISLATLGHIFMHLFHLPRDVKVEGMRLIGASLTGHPWANRMVKLLGKNEPETLSAKMRQAERMVAFLREDKQFRKLHKRKPLFRVLCDPSVLTKAHFETYRVHMCGSIQASTAQKHTGGIIALMSQLGNPKFSLKDFKAHQQVLEQQFEAPKTPRPVLTHSQVMKWFKVWKKLDMTVEQKQIFYIVRTMYEACARVEEITGLRREFVIEPTRNTRFLQIFPSKSKTQKKDKRVKALTLMCDQKLAWWRMGKRLNRRIAKTKAGDLLFPQQNGKPFTTTMVNDVIEWSYGEVAKQFPELAGLENVTSHLFRITHSNVLIDMGFTEPEVERYGRWQGGQKAYLQKGELRQFARQVQSVALAQDAPEVRAGVPLPKKSDNAQKRELPQKRKKRRSESSAMADTPKSTKQKRVV